MAKKKTEELEDLESELEDLDASEDEDASEDADSDDDDASEDGDESEDSDASDDSDDEEEAPKKSKKKGTKKRKAREDGKVGTFELAEALGTDGRNLRVMLRDRKVKKNAENNRYEWDSVEAALKAMKFKNVKAAQTALAESRQARLDELKDRVAKKREEEGKSEKKSSSKKSSKKK